MSHDVALPIKAAFQALQMNSVCILCIIFCKCACVCFVKFTKLKGCGYMTSWSVRWGSGHICVQTAVRMCLHEAQTSSECGASDPLLNPSCCLRSDLCWELFIQNTGEHQVWTGPKPAATRATACFHKNRDSNSNNKQTQMTCQGKYNYLLFVYTHIFSCFWTHLPEEPINSNNNNMQLV